MRDRLTEGIHSGRVACAYYDPVKCTIYVLEDTPDNKHFDLTKAFLEQASPDVVLSSFKADDRFMDVLSEHVDGSGGTFQVRPYKDFIPLKGRDRLLSLRFLTELPIAHSDHDSVSEVTSASEPRNAYDFMRRRKEVGGDPAMQTWNASVRLANFTNLENSPLCLGSIGALLDYLARARAVSELDDEGVTGLEVSNIEPLRLVSAMQINADALFSLQIFEDENHASIHSDKTKEGLSLFGILNNTMTTLGRALMREWFLRPSMSLDVINARHDAVQCFTRPDNLTTQNAMHGHLKGTKNVPKVLLAMRSGRAKVSDWQGLVKFAYHGLLLRDCLSELNHASGVDVVKRLLSALEVASLRDIGNLVNETIDWEESTTAGRVCVRPRIDEELDNLKHIYNGIDAVLSKVAEQVSATIPPGYTPSLNVVYFPQLGFLICIPMQDEWRTEAGISVLDGWSFQSQEMHDMDVHIGDLHPAIVDREIEIIQALQEKILVYDQAIGHACDVCAELDCLISFSMASRSYDYRRPDMTEENVMDIKQGRHPLQELAVSTFVPNDTYLIGGAGIGATLERDDEDENDDSQVHIRNSIMVCTGANACGKSVYLKQIAIIQYMAQFPRSELRPSFVPAERATLGVVDKSECKLFMGVLRHRIAWHHDIDVFQVQSAFMIDLNQVSLALRNATAHGAGLFCGVLKHLLSSGISCPKVVATTHFHDVFQNDLLSPYKLPITFVRMQVLLASDSSSSSVGGDTDPSEREENSSLGPGDRITYLYKVANGYSLHSHAITCAELFGMPRRITSRAQYVSELLARHEVSKLLDEDMTDRERQELEEAEEVCRRFLAWDFTSRSGRDNEPAVRDALAHILGREVLDG
ncbi:DNA mismatch repair protein MutS [Earliella scabrosa]|nr:DNA mismatch repair protein MutS [Earliella scabrosa]